MKLLLGLLIGLVLGSAVTIGAQFYDPNEQVRQDIFQRQMQQWLMQQNQLNQWQLLDRARGLHPC